MIMRRKKILVTSAVVAAACLFGACGKKDSKSQLPLQPHQSEQPVTSYESVQKFGYSLFAQCIQDKNPVLSPVSAYLALSMAGCGAEHTTREEFDSVLGKDMMALSGDMMDTLPAKGDLLNLSIADAAWINDDFVVDDTWLP